MDVATDTTRRRRLIPSDKNNAPKTKEVSSRYRSPTPTPTKTSRCPSPTVTRPTLSSTSQSIASKRALSADRKRPSDSVSLPISKKERPVDRTLRPSSNISHKHKSETNSLTRKPTPERKISPLKVKNLLENSKPVDGPHTRLIEQHRWPSRTGAKFGPNLLNISLDLGDKSLRRMSLPLYKTSSNGVLLSPTKSQRLLSARVTCSSSFARPSTPPSRGVSPSRTSNSTQSTTTASSVLSFITDVKKGKKASYIEDVHQLRLLHNRYLQWRFAIARAETVMYIQRLTSEEALFNVWHAISELKEDVTRQMIGLQELKLEIKLNSLLNDQMVSLEEWAILERDHVSSLVGAIADLEANTLCLPLTGGTKADVESLKAAMSSALDVMQAMGSSIWSLLSKVEEMNKMVSELAVVATRESCMQEECEDLLASTAIMQIKEFSVRTHLIQTRREGEEDAEEETSPLLPLSKFPWS